MKRVPVLVAITVVLAGVVAMGQPSQKDILLLHNGDKIMVNFAAGSNGSIQFKSLSATSCIDVENSRREGFDKFVFTDQEGWKTYPRKLDGAKIAITLHEVQDNNKKLATAELPYDSDVVVRIVNSGPPRVAGGDNSKKGTKCPVCNATLAW